MVAMHNGTEQMPSAVKATCAVKPNAVSLLPRDRFPGPQIC